MLMLLARQSKADIKIYWTYTEDAGTKLRPHYRLEVEQRWTMLLTGVAPYNKRLKFFATCKNQTKLCGMFSSIKQIAVIASL